MTDSKLSSGSLLRPIQHQLTCNERSYYVFAGDDNDDDDDDDHSESVKQRKHFPSENYI